MRESMLTSSQPVIYHISSSQPISIDDERTLLREPEVFAHVTLKVVLPLSSSFPFLVIKFSLDKGSTLMVNPDS